LPGEVVVSTTLSSIFGYHSQSGSERATEGDGKSEEAEEDFQSLTPIEKGEWIVGTLSAASATDGLHEKGAYSRHLIAKFSSHVIGLVCQLDDIASLVARKEREGVAVRRLRGRNAVDMVKEGRPTEEARKILDDLHTEVQSFRRPANS
jgi:hypothetical protein